MVNKVILLLVVAVICMLLIAYTLYTLHYKLKNRTISVVILSHNRPHNIEKTLPILVTYPIIDEIVILHGLPEFYKEFQFPKVRNVKDYENNAVYGGARRWFCTKHVKNNIILILDDDLYPSKALLYKTYSTLQENFVKNTIYGTIIRKCDTTGYKNTHVTKSSYDTILTGYVMCKKQIVQDYMKYYFTKHKDWFIKHRGNCEDLSMNLFIRKFYKENPVYVEGRIHTLDKSNGYSSHKKHYEIRNTFCKTYN